MRNWEYAWEQEKKEVLRSSYEDLAREAYRMGYEAGHYSGYAECEDEREEECCAKC